MANDRGFTGNIASASGENRAQGAASVPGRRPGWSATTALLPPFCAARPRGVCRAEGSIGAASHWKRMYGRRRARRISRRTVRARSLAQARSGRARCGSRWIRPIQETPRHDYHHSARDRPGRARAESELLRSPGGNTHVSNALSKRSWTRGPEEVRFQTGFYDPTLQHLLTLLLAEAAQNGLLGTAVRRASCAPR